MRKFTVSALLGALEQLSPGIESLELTGANLSSARWFKNLLQSPEVEVLELFVSPADYQRRDVMAAIAKQILPPEKVGKGALRFYPVHFLPEIWSDGAARVLMTLDPELLARERYLRDRFAVGPTVISCQTHGMGLPGGLASLAEIARAEPVEFDVITCVSKSCKASLERTFDGYLLPAGSQPPLKLEVVPNPVDTDRFSPASDAERRRARSVLELPSEGTMALYLGRLTPNSKCDLLPLIRQFAKVSGPTDLLVLAGAENVPGYAASLVAAASAAGIGDRVMVRRHVEPSLASLYYAAADLFVFPCDNIQEAFANTIMEAMASGLPVLGSSWDGVRDLVEDGVTGKLIPTYLMPGLSLVEAMYPVTPIMATFLLTGQNIWVDEEAMGIALRELLENRELRTQMGSAGREQALQGYRWGSVGARLFQLWEELLNGASSIWATDAGRRKRATDSSTLAAPLRHLFEPYATKLANPATTLVSLTPHGQEIMKGKAQLAFYDETLALIRPEVVEALRNRLGSLGLGSVKMKEIAENAAAMSRQPEDIVLFHIGLLAKRGVISLRMNG